MSFSNLKKMLVCFSSIAVISVNAQAARSYTYVVTVANGSQMPISPGVVFSSSGLSGKAKIGDESTPGFIQLCQTGNPSLRLQEVQMNSTFAKQTAGPILPGGQITFEATVRSPISESIHFEAMYGKTKDLCASASVNSHSLVALAQHVTKEIVLKDDVLQTGVFTDPALSNVNTSPDMLCVNEKDAVSCLRSLSTAKNGKANARFFGGYLPSLVSFLENKYGSTDTQSLVVPTSGALQIKVTLKHQ